MTSQDGMLNRYRRHYMTNLPSVEASPLRSFMDQYFEAWREGAPEKVLGYFSEDAVINLWGPAGTLAGKKMVAEKWVIPTVTNYPGNIHQIKSFLEAGDQVAVEWLFTGANVSTGKEINIPGCSVYWVSGGLIRRGNVYFNSRPPKRDHALPVLDPAHHSDRLGQAGPQALTKFLAVSTIELS
jgi:ketosteroid isomerase-like protein